MVQIVLITGFLGSGKTTVLAQILENMKDKKIGIIVNEFGDISIDGKILSRQGFDMVEINNGSIFCSCLKDKFLDVLIELVQWDFDYIFVESTGLADPSNMDKIIEVLGKKAGDVFQYRGSIALVDGEFFEDLFDMLPAIERQILFADWIVLNKADTRTEEELDRIKEKIRSINPVAKLEVTTYGALDYSALLTDLESGWRFHGESTNTPESRLTVFKVDLEENLDRESFIGFLKEVCTGAYRMKGYGVLNGKVHQISCVNCAIQVKEEDADSVPLQLVIISSVGIKWIRLAEKAWKNKFDTAPKIIL
ncbi:GTP-binding protein [Alkalibacter rhizosphaerae]|uniref:GTP-binding protein n=1 Tax=Alkalibacter rhizosphaerae TaxID=2815577 RepID=A0A974XI84_9FIRM|nr:GTP-binding protein [Alkalibacter rhizosphaerae]QSX09225.1 GTP-binding protein [Alkalibacter rhizosphaerae]